MTKPAAVATRGPRRVFEWVDEEITTVEIAATVDADETGHIVLTIEQRPGDWEAGDTAPPIVRIRLDLDGTNAIKVRDILDEAVTWGREYLS